MMFALFDPGTDKTLTDCALIFGGLLAGLYYGKEIFFGSNKRQISPQPLIVSAAGNPVDKKEFDEFKKSNAEAIRKLEQSYNEIRNQIRSDKDEILLAGEHRGQRIHERIDAVLEAVSELRGRMLGRPS